MSVRSELRAQVFEWADNQCEHPRYHEPLYGLPVAVIAAVPEDVALFRCQREAKELAHIFPRGMGHTGYRDTFENVMAACTLHARSTDDLSSSEWLHVPPPHDRKALKEWVKEQRVAAGWVMEEQT